MFLRLLLTPFIFLSITTQAAVWSDVNSWSPEFESRYSEWVRTSWTPDFFSRKNLPNGQSNPYYGLRVDCADTVYSMRLIYSYENHLPFIIQDPTASGKTLSNKMSRWDGQSEINRVRNFLGFIYETVSTRSLPNDTFPVAINRTAIRPGGLMMTTKKNHHSWTIKEILPIGVPHLIFNSVVGANSGYGLYERQSWPNPDWVFESDASPSGNAGFRDWRPAAYLNRPVWETPGYSEEQYHIPLNNWIRFAQGRLAISQETDAQLIGRLLRTTCEGLQGRVQSIKEGLTYLQSHPRCMDYADYDTYSTPNRDRRIFDDFISLRRSYKEILRANGGHQLSPELLAQLNKIFPAISLSTVRETSQMQQQGLSAESLCVTPYLPGKSMDLAEFKRRLFRGLISNNPHDGADYRWGELKGPSKLAQSCPSWDPWSPDLNQD